MTNANIAKLKEWWKDGSPLNPSEDISSRIVKLSNGNLLIKGLISSDEGNYTCKATNPLGEASSSGRVMVLRKDNFFFKDITLFFSQFYCYK